MNKKKIRWLTQTALFLTLVIVIQYGTAGLAKPMGQYITGSLVNLMLITATCTVGFGSGATVGILSSVLAFLLGIGPPFIQAVPAISLGNIVLVTVIWTFGLWAKRVDGGKQKSRISILSIIVAAVVKWAVIWGSVHYVILPFFIDSQSKGVAVLTTLVSYPQVITALIGGALSLIVVPIIRVNEQEKQQRILEDEELRRLQNAKDTDDNPPCRD